MVTQKSEVRGCFMWGFLLSSFLNFALVRSSPQILHRGFTYRLGGASVWTHSLSHLRRSEGGGVLSGRSIYSQTILPSVQVRTLYSQTALLGRRGSSMPRGVKKENLPEKVCVVCNRPFTWRKKWERCWDEVTTCSKSCNAKRRAAKQKGGEVESEADI